MREQKHTFLSVVIPPLQGSFTYRVNQDAAHPVDVGSRVEVPFGSRVTFGFVVEKQNEEPQVPEGKKKFQIKDIRSPESSHPCFKPEQLTFFKWVAEYYSDTIANVIDVAVPAPVTRKFEKIFTLKQRPESPLKGKLQNEILSIFENKGHGISQSEILKRFRGASQALAALEKKGIISVEKNELLDAHVKAALIPAWAKSEVSLNEAQQRALADIIECVKKKEFRPFLLHGVTGSGKTEVYIEAIRTLKELGLGALVVVPEIALTPQLVDRFRARLGTDLAVLHSALHKRERWDGWRALLEERNMIAIGARSAIFAPVPRLGLIIVDEEHDSSYKQNEGLRYHARDLALVRGKLEQCPVVLGSATPCLETFHNAVTGKYGLLSLPARHESSSSIDIEVVDLNSVKPYEMITKHISPKLHEQLKDALEKQEQAFILYNRRGFASYFQCEKCENVLHCPHCSVTLTYHQTQHSLLCHYCNLSMVPPEFCAECSSSPPGKLVHRGAGTEKVFDELKELFPSASIDRLDRDSVEDEKSYRDILDRVRRGETSILVGTQMIAKGHDLPGVTLVGIVDCDIGLHMPDFRAGERVFQLLTQASGRAGRAEKTGHVVLQTRVPQHPSLIKTAAKDFEGFARVELKNRALLGYPPYSRILRIVVSAQDKHVPDEILQMFRNQAQTIVEKEHHKVLILGPAPAPLGKLRSLWRSHMLFKSKSARSLNDLMRSLKMIKVDSKKVKVMFDLDPQDML